MPLLTAALCAYLATRHGVVSDAELAAHGITRARRRSLVRAGVLVTLHPGVYHLTATPLTLAGRCRAICLAAPGAVITGAAAGKLWDLRRIPDPTIIEVRLPWYSNRFRCAGVRIRRCPPLPEVDVVTREDGIRIVSPPRLAFDLAAPLDDLDLESVVEQILDRGWCTIGTLRDTGRRLIHPSRPGSNRFARVLDRRPDWLRPADSHHEVVLFDALRSAGVAGLVRQHQLDLPGGFSIHADVAVPALRWVLPIDHVTWHGGRLDAQRDKQTDRQVRMLGWHVDRVTDDDIDHHLDAVVDELLAIHRRLVAEADGRPAA